MVISKAQFPGQLSMFATARELRHGASNEADDFPDFWERKLEETKLDQYPDWHDSAGERIPEDRRMWESIKKEGVRTPVSVSYVDVGGKSVRRLNAGHHRVAAQYDIDPDRLIPLYHTDKLFDGPNAFGTGWFGG